MELTQSLVLSILAAAIQRKPILVSTSTRLDRAAIPVQQAVATLFECARPMVIKCEKWTSWKSLENDMQHALRVAEYVLLANPAALDAATQAHLTEILQSGRYQIIFIGPSKGICRILRKQIFFQVQVPAGDDQAVSGPGHLGIPSRLEDLRARSAKVHISSEVGQYAQDILVFTRTHRFVKRGVPPVAVEYLTQLVRVLSVFAGLEHAVPQTVDGAARLVLPLQIDLCDAGDDLSLEYGGDLGIVAGWLKNWDAALLVDNVIDLVPAPL